MLCTECTAAYNKWLDSKPSKVLNGGVKFANHATYDDTAAGLRDNASHRFEQWRQLVRRQTDLIARLCKEGKHAEAR